MAKQHRVFSRATEQELMHHPGEWAALDGDRIIAFGPDPKTVYAAAAAAGIDVPLLYRVPDPTITYFYGAALDAVGV